MAPFIDWLYSGLCWQLLNCSHLLCFALKPSKSPNRICWHSHEAACHSADWYRGDGCVFLRFTVAVCMLWCAIELLEVLLFDSSISSRTFSTLFLFRMDSIEIFHACVSVCAVSRSHQSTVANSKEIEYNVFFGCRLNAIYCCSTLFKWPAFLKAETAVSFSLHGKPVTTTRHHLTAEDGSL